MLNFPTRTLKEPFVDRFHITDVTSPFPARASQIAESLVNHETLALSKYIPEVLGHMRMSSRGWFLLGIEDVTFDSPLSASQILECLHNPESLPKSNHIPRFPAHLVTLTRVYERLA
ncbi:hypothetical protein ONZ45_g19621 [Pleurotus djamor]|nr:hypothetical protein ONZ45_g19621 [Pleurotus djamor]